MEDSVSLNNGGGSIILKEYNDIMKEIVHLGESSLFDSTKETLKLSVDDNQLLSETQASVLQRELNALKVQLDRNQMLRHVNRDNNQQKTSLPDMAICELESVIKRKETIIETMERVLDQSQRLYDGREIMIKSIKERVESLKRQYEEMDQQRMALLTESEGETNSSEEISTGDSSTAALKRLMRGLLENRFKIDLKHASGESVYFTVHIRINENTKNSSEKWHSNPFHCVLCREHGEGSYMLKHVVYGNDRPLNIEKLNTTPLLFPMLVDLVNKITHKHDSTSQ